MARLEQDRQEQQGLVTGLSARLEEMVADQERKINRVIQEAEQEELEKAHYIQTLEAKLGVAESLQQQLEQSRDSQRRQWEEEISRLNKELVARESELDRRGQAEHLLRKEFEISASRLRDKLEENDSLAAANIDLASKLERA